MYCQRGHSGNSPSVTLTGYRIRLHSLDYFLLFHHFFFFYWTLRNSSERPIEFYPLSDSQLLSTSLILRVHKYKGKGSRYVFFNWTFKESWMGNVLMVSDTCVFTAWRFISSEGVTALFPPNRPGRQRGPARVSALHKCIANWVLMGTQALIFCQHGGCPKRKRGCLSFSNDAPCAIDNSDKTGQGCSTSRPGHAIPVGNRV